MWAEPTGVLKLMVNSGSSVQSVVGPIAYFVGLDIHKERILIASQSGTANALLTIRSCCCPIEMVDWRQRMRIIGSHVLNTAATFTSEFGLRAI